MYNGHLSIEQIEQLSRQESQSSRQQNSDDWTHVEHCELCRSLVEKCRLIDARLGKLASTHLPTRSGMNCPDPSTWFEVAAGALPDAESLKYLEHAAVCDNCGKELKIATRIFAPDLSAEEQEILESIPGSKIIQQIRASESQAIPKPASTGRPFFSSIYRRVAFAAVAVAMICFAPLLYQEYQLYSSKESVRSAYLHDRRMPYRPALAPYGENKQELGSESIGSSVTIPDPRKEPCLAAEGEFLNHNYESAINILKTASNSGKNSTCVLNDLVVAYALKADYTHERSFYDQALIISDNTKDPMIYFNRAIIYSKLGKYAESCKSLKEFLALEHGTAWVSEAEKLDCSR